MCWLFPNKPALLPRDLCVCRNAPAFLHYETIKAHLILWTTIRFGPCVSMILRFFLYCTHGCGCSSFSAAWRPFVGTRAHARAVSRWTSPTQTPLSASKYELQSPCQVERVRGPVEHEPFPVGQPSAANGFSPAGRLISLKRSQMWRCAPIRVGDRLISPR